MHAVVAGCGPSVEPSLEPDAEGSTGHTGEIPMEPGSTSELGESSSTGDAPATTGGLDLEPDTETDTDTDGEPQDACTSTACTTTCLRSERMETASGDVCECERADYPTDHVHCDLGNRCGDDRLCILQAVRYGVVGTYRLDELAGDDPFTLVIDVLGDGRARAYVYGWTHDCCDGTDVNEFGTLYHPQAVVDADDAMWRECLRFHAPEFDEIPECLLPENMFAGSCEPPLLECPPQPEAPDPDAPCDASCRMVADEVCDEQIGTGLCGDGCDPIDCACTTDVPGECNASYGDAACPLGSDPDCGGSVSAGDSG